MSCSKSVLWAFCFLYNALLVIGTLLLLPLLTYTVVTKAKRRRTFLPRMGWCRYPWQKDAKPIGQHIWVHALSVGEVQAAQPLVARIHQSAPRHRICLTTSTLTGYQIASQLFHHHSCVDLAYFPYDWIWAVRSVISKIKPTVVILTETDIWPNFLMAMHRRNIPVHLVNLRFSDHSWAKFQRFSGTMCYLFNLINKISVQSEDDLNRLVQLGVAPEKIAVTGNIKFDAEIPQIDQTFKTVFFQRWQLCKKTKIIVAGSTHQGEEEILINVLRSLYEKKNDLLLIIAPRDPRRSSEIITLGRSYGFDCQLFSTTTSENGARPDIVVIDVIGVLKKIYHMAEIVFIGGSLVKSGGHNPLEPAACGKPVLFGPDMSDFTVISKFLNTAGGAVQVKGMSDLAITAYALLTKPGFAQTMGQRALSVFKSHQGAVDRTLAFLKLDQANSKTADTVLC